MHAVYGSGAYFRRLCVLRKTGEKAGLLGKSILKFKCALRIYCADKRSWSLFDNARNRVCSGLLDAYEVMLSNKIQPKLQKEVRK